MCEGSFLTTVEKTEVLVCVASRLESRLPLSPPISLSLDLLDHLTKWWERKEGENCQSEHELLR